MENKEIMERLLQDDRSSNSAVKSEATNEKNDRNGDSQMSRVRVVTAKYKVFIIILVILICLLGLEYIPSAKNSLESSEKAYTQVQDQLKGIERDIDFAKANMEYLCNKDNWIIKNEATIKNCLNNGTDCSDLPDLWKTWSGEDADYDLRIPLSYLQLHSLYNKKMPVDEKVVLKNLNEYLIKQNIVGWEKSRVWEILRIEIWDPKSVNEWDEHFFEVEVNVEIEFSTVNDLVGFLHNVEKKLIDNWNDRILYKIQSVSYDIVSNDEPQITDISMIAYYYHDEKFDNKVECGGNEEEVVDEDLEDEMWADISMEDIDESQLTLDGKNPEAVFDSIFGE